jgi:hypothetical protein
MGASAPLPAMPPAGDTVPAESSDQSSELVAAAASTGLSAASSTPTTSLPFPSLAALRADINSEHLRAASPADLERLLQISRQTSGGCVTSADVVVKLRSSKVVTQVQSHLDTALALYRERSSWPCIVLLKLKMARFQASMLCKASYLRLCLHWWLLPSVIMAFGSMFLLSVPGSDESLKSRA